MKIKRERERERERGYTVKKKKAIKKKRCVGFLINTPQKTRISPSHVSHIQLSCLIFFLL